MAKKPAALLTALFVLVFAFSAHAEASSFLDRTVSINWLHFAKSADLFTADAEAQGVLRITNTTPDKSYWGYVVLNGRTYWLNNNDTFVQPVSLKRFNAFFVSLLGAPGTALHIEILPPKPEIISFTIAPNSVVQGSTATLAWATENADTVAIEPGIGPVDPDGSVTVAPDATTTYTLTAANAYGSVSETATVTVLVPPAITIVEPNGLNDIADESFTIQWEDEDPDSDATISLYYDTDNTGADGILIALGLGEDPDGVDDQFTWDISTIMEGDYYIYAVIDDGVTPAVIAYSPGPVTVLHNIPPEITLTSISAFVGDGSYEYVDSRYSNTLLYNWLDITAVGTEILLTGFDDAYSVNLPFEFPFFGDIKSSILISSNGYLTFGNYGTNCNNRPIPEFFDPNDFIAPYWDDIVPDKGGSFHYYYDSGNQIFIVQYTEVLPYADDAPKTFQVILYPNGDILFQYKEMQGNLTSATVGVEDKYGTEGLELAYDKAFIEDNLAILIKRAVSKNAIGWNDEDPDDNAAISLYYDTDNTGADGILIIAGIEEDPDGLTEDQYIWDSSEVAEGTYYVYAVIDDGVNVPVVSYYPEPITIDRSSPRFDELPEQEGMENESLTFTVQAQDPNNDSLTYSASNLPEGAIFNSDTRVFSWTPTSDQTGEYYVEFTVTDGEHTDTMSVRITITLHLPVVSIIASPSTVVPGGSTVLSWSSTYADTCYIEPNIGSVATSGSVTVSPEQITVYTITAVGPGGTTTRSATVSITPPSVSLTANLPVIQYGEEITLTWTSTYAETCTIEPGIGDVPLNGSVTVSPEETTTYTITATGPGGVATRSTTLTVKRPPQVSLNVSQAVINYGESIILTWEAWPAQRAYLNNGIGLVSASGSMTLTPEYTTTYTFTAVNNDQSTCQTISVKVLGHPPEPQPEGTFGGQYNDLIPEDASLESYDPDRFVVATGLVRDMSGIPLPEVAVNVLGHPEYGTVLTDENGRYSIPAEGGGLLKLSFEKQGYLTSHRKIEASVTDILILKTVTLISPDTAETTIFFNGDPSTITVHKSTETLDAELGDRSCTMVFTGEAKAYEVDEFGNQVQELSLITVRASEYATPESMPAILPPNSGYTYCVELEASGFDRVMFDKPVIAYVNNFLGFDVGEIVPSGYYDRGRSAWVPSDNGVVVKLLDTDNDGVVDALDADSDDLPDDLNENGVLEDEVAGLNDPGTYSPGATFWRVPINHFSPWDFNWSFGIPENAISSNAESPPDVDEQKPTVDDCDKDSNSYVNIRSRILHEDIPLPGTGMSLHYASNWVKGASIIIDVPVSGASVPASLKQIIVNMEVAGRMFEQVLAPLPNQAAKFVWDKRDYRGDWVEIPVVAHIHIGFEYGGVYYEAEADYKKAFAQSGADTVTNVPSRQNVILWETHETQITPIPPVDKNVDSQLAEGWTLSSQHSLYMGNIGVLNKGNGEKIERNAVIITTIAGGNGGGYSGDGGPAVDAQLAYPTSVTMDMRGNLYIADSTYEIVGGAISIKDIIRKVDKDGNITTFFEGPIIRSIGNLDIEVAPDGMLYILSRSENQLRRVDLNGIVSIVAGIATSYPPGMKVFAGDGGPAIEARLYHPQGMEIDASGNIYIADTDNHCVRRISPDGIIEAFAGMGVDAGYSGDGGLAVDARLQSPTGLAVDKTGNLFIADSGNFSIRKVDPKGVITTIAGGNGPGYSGDGWPAVDAQLQSISEITLDSSGNLYLTGYDHIRKINQDGIITTIAGGNGSGHSGDGGPAIYAQLGLGLNDIIADPRGNLYILDTSYCGVRKVGPAPVVAGSVGVGEVIFVEENGLGHIMLSNGRHSRTIDTASGVVLKSFTYDTDNRLVSITDQFGNVTTVERSSDGRPTAIISPDGLRTDLSVDPATSHLNRITHPDGGYYDFGYTTGGLMEYEIDPAGNRFDHIFDIEGRLSEVLDEEHGHQYYEQMKYPSGDILTTVTTAEGNVTSYLDRTELSGEYTSIITDAPGGQTTYIRSADGFYAQKDLACGMALDFEYGIDPAYKYKFIKESHEIAPSGISKRNQLDISYEDTDLDEAPDLITRSVTVNGKTTTVQKDVIQSTVTATSPEGRATVSSYDPDTLVTLSTGIAGLYQTNYGYYADGRPKSVMTGTRETSFAYDSYGYLASVTDPRSLTTYFTNDLAGRVTHIARPDGTNLGFEYDANGNMTVLTNPSNVDHLFGYNGVDLKSFYTTPLSGSYSYSYDKDRRLVQKDFPSGQSIYWDYTNPSDATDKSRLWRVITPEGDIDYTYLCGNKVESVSTVTEAIAYGYDGKLVTSETLYGTINKTLSYTYNEDFNVESFTYAGATEGYLYDNDGLLTGAGGFTISRYNDPGVNETGLPYNVTNGAFSLGRTFNGYGETGRESSTVGGYDVYEWNVIDRYADGRIKTKTETIGGVTTTFGYTYDEMGRLETVTKDGSLVESYDHDTIPYGTCTYQMNSLRGIAGRVLDYDAEDHLLSAGGTDYQYDLDGFLTSKTSGTETTYYDYSSRGELLSVDLPDGTDITYVHDPLGRRIAKKVNGTITEKYLWSGLTTLLAVYDGSDNLLMRFVYADGRMPVAVEKGGITYYLAYDQVGSLRAVADAAGNIVKQIDYDSFGFMLNDTYPGFEIPFGFAGGLYDKDTGLVRFGYRDYDPNTGRWTAKDPIGFNGGASDLYGYCLNDPVNMIDGIGLAGFAIDAGGGYGTGWGTNNYSEGGSAGTGLFIGVKPDTGGYAQLGAYTYQSYADEIPGARLGAGFNATYYKGDSADFFKGEMNYTMLTLFIASLTKYSDPCTGKTTGWTVSLGGKGYGLTWFEKGTSKSWSYALQE
ncbi:NHL domain-containing protein [Desulfosudis oleivorans]|uniref:YD repeat protein n=1 Tax=Desulfosudis oleivorans (strain DSM 6200 / JCM 39069 / Hxd3) TaxID=96561 RepID=A8ZVU3_DESOH|nr:RHS repeat-associated core domain-containing protein [Desulfosudis oleivorans]ABW66652.1 YD repeat protein [Desulfosudis oleivorans Hxd3]